MLTDAQLAQLRATAERTMTQEATILRVTHVSDGAGGFTTVETVLGPYPCRVGASTALARGEIVTAEQLRDGLPWMITLPATVIPLLSDEITVEDRTFSVLNVRAPATYSTATQCLCMQK